jgi:hypothetical protein
MGRLTECKVDRPRSVKVANMDKHWVSARQYGEEIFVNMANVHLIRRKGSGSMLVWGPVNGAPGGRDNMVLSSTPEQLFAQMIDERQRDS